MKKKDNKENGEENRDGADCNNSANYGSEGTTNDKNILKLRKRQIKNFYISLILSRGIPMILMGDEYGHTKKGNNNTCCHDDEKNHFLWDDLTKNQDLY